jgi:hypothetical protein
LAAKEFACCSPSSEEKGKVIAVDPAELKVGEDFYHEKHLVHLQQLATLSEDFLETVSEALHDGVNTKQQEINIITCDANIHPGHAAKLVLHLRPLQARREFWAVISLKNFCGQPGRWRESIEEVVAVLKREEFSCQVMHLFANAPYEKTLIAHRKE